MSLKPTAPLDASAAQRHAAWGDAVSTVTQVLTSGVGCDARAFQPLVDVASRRGPSVDGALTVEWVVAPDAARCGVTVFQHGSGRDPLDAGRVLSAERFDAAALDAWDALAEALAGLDVASHVGLAWDRQRGFRLKLFVSGEADLAAAARIVGVTPGPGLVGVGCDFWDGGRYRPRRYFVGRSFADLAAQRGADATLPEGLAPVPPDGHAVLTLTQADDALGAKTTWSVIFPPGLPVSAVAPRVSASTALALTDLAARVAPFPLCPSALELDVYDDGRAETELLVTLGSRHTRPRG